MQMTGSCRECVYTFFRHIGGLGVSYHNDRNHHKLDSITAV